MIFVGYKDAKLGTSFENASMEKDKQCGSWAFLPADKVLFSPGRFLAKVAVLKVIIHHTGCLHVCITDSRAEEFEASLFHIFCYRI